MVIRRPHRKKVRHYHQLGDFRELTFSCCRRLPLLTNNDWQRRLHVEAGVLLAPIALDHRTLSQVPLFRRSFAPCSIENHSPFRTGCTVDDGIELHLPIELCRPLARGTQIGVCQWHQARYQSLRYLGRLYPSQEASGIRAIPQQPSSMALEFPIDGGQLESRRRLESMDRSGSHVQKSNTLTAMPMCLQNFEPTVSQWCHKVLLFRRCVVPTVSRLAEGFAVRHGLHGSRRALSQIHIKRSTVGVAHRQSVACHKNSSSTVAPGVEVRVAWVYWTRAFSKIMARLHLDAE
jgi:hypothetical protein